MSDYIEEDAPKRESPRDAQIELRRQFARAKRARMDAEVEAGIKAERKKQINDLVVTGSNLPDNPNKLPENKSQALHGKVQTYLNADADEVSQIKPTRLRRIMESLYDTATDTMSPKQVAAAKLLFERAWGATKPSDEALDALAKGGIQLVYVAAPEVPAAEERKALPSKPEFIDAELVEEQ